MAEPAELLLIKDQYELACHSLSHGQAAEEAGKTGEALVYYRKGLKHLTQGIEVPTRGERQQGVSWDTARQLQQRMRETLRTVNAHLSDLETSQLTTGCHLLVNLSPNLYPDLAPNSQPPQSSLHHLYPTIPTITQSTTPYQKTPPVWPLSPAAVHTHTLPAAATGTTDMANPGDQPPAYTPQPTVGHRSLAYGPARGGLRSGKQTGAAAAGGDGNELLFIPSGVQIFFVAANGQVSSLSHPGFLCISTFDSDHKDAPAGRPSAFLHVCDWMYPLTADTPVLLANSGIFMFPDSLAETPGSFVGIVLSSELPAADRETFKDLLSQLADLRVQGPEGAGSEVINLSEKIPLGPSNEQTRFTVPTAEKDGPQLPGWSEKIAQGILSGATKFSQQFAKGAEATGRAVHIGAAKMRDHITPEETPSQVSPRVTKGLQVAKQTTGGALQVSRFLVNGVSKVAGQVVEKVAPHVKKHSAKLVPESMKKSKDGRASNFDGAKFVAASSVQGLSTIWSSLETGAKVVGKSVASETVMTVKYKYGDDASQATDTALQSVVDVGVTAYNIDSLVLQAFLNTADQQSAKAKGPDLQPAQTEGKGVQKKEEEKKK